MWLLLALVILPIRCVWLSRLLPWHQVRAIINSECAIPFNITARGDLDLDELQVICVLPSPQSALTPVTVLIFLSMLQSEMPEKIAAAKCRLAARVVGGPVLVDDTSLCFRALNGLPGPYIKWFQQKLGSEGLLRMLHGFDDRHAWAQCSVAFSPGPGAEPCVFIGRTDGEIVDGVGTSGFGWDAIFRPDGFQQTFAEMDVEEKNRISHRGRALRQLAAFLQVRE